MSEAATSINLNNLFDATMDQIEDAPEFITPPNGAYKVLVKSVERKENKGKNFVRFLYEVQEVVQLTGPVAPGENPPVPKSMFSEQFNIDGEGIKYLKRHVKEVWKNYPQMGLGSLLKAIEGQSYGVVVKQRNYKDDEGNQKTAFNTMGLVVG